MDHFLLPAQFSPTALVPVVYERTQNKVMRSFWSYNYRIKCFLRQKKPELVVTFFQIHSATNLDATMPFILIPAEYSRSKVTLALGCQWV